MFEAIMIIAFGGTVAMQWYILTTYKERFTKIARVIKGIDERKAEKDHTHDYIGGSMDMVYQGRKAPTVQAHIYPKRLK